MDLARGICGAHGGYDTANVYTVRRIGGGHGLRRGAETIVGRVFPGRLQSFRHQCRPVDDCSPGQEKWRRTAEKEVERFMARLIAAKKTRTGLRQNEVVKLSAKPLDY